jgi:hypothetical protein
VAGGIDNFTVLMLHCNGADASTTFTDSSNFAHAVTRAGNAQIDTAQSKFGGASCLLDGAGDYLTTPDSADWAFGGGDFTIDAWVQFTLHKNVQVIASQWETSAGSQKSWKLAWVAATNSLNFYYSTNGSSTSIALSRTWSPVTNNVWYHIAVVRVGNICRLFVNGVQLGGDGTISGPLKDSTAALLIGATNPSSTADYWNGWLDEVRISKGIARWTTAFTPPTDEYTTVPPPTNTATPVITGTPTVGQILSTDDGTWFGTPTGFAYQWQRDNLGAGTYSNITNATATSYTIVDADDACRIRCEVTASNDGGAGIPADSNAVGPVIEVLPVNTVAPVIAGAAVSTLSVSDGIWTGMSGTIATFVRSWEISNDGVSGWTPISGNTTHNIVPAEVGKYIRVTVTATNSAGSTPAVTAVFGPLVSTALACKVEMAFGSGPGSSAPTWTDISSYVRSLNWNRGRQNELNQMQAGTGHMVLNDPSSHFDPRNTGSPFYPNVRPGTPVRASITVGYGSYPLFRMTTERQPRTVRIGTTYTERQIDMVDGFAVLANAGISGTSYDQESSDTRVNNVLDTVGWPAAKRRIGVGASTLQTVTFPDDAGETGLNHLLAVNDSENGLMFCDGNGDIVFVGRHELIQQSGYTTSAASFGDAHAVG